MSHRDSRLDGYCGKRVKVLFADGSTYIGLLQGFNERSDRYVLTNCINDKTGFPKGNIEFRKSHIKRLEVK